MTGNIRVFTQSSIRIEGSCGVIYLDPLHIPEEFHDAAFILITHNHGDHFNLDSLKTIALYLLSRFGIANLLPAFSVP